MSRLKSTGSLAAALVAGWKDAAMSRRAAREGRFTLGFMAFGGNVSSMFTRGTGDVMEENAPEGLERKTERKVTTFRESIRW
jgi:hypothetical protein